MSKLFPSSSAKPIWSGVYSTWQEACEIANSGNISALTSDRWLYRIGEQLADYQCEFSKYRIAVPPRPSNLPMVCGLAKPSSILDFGGSSGWCWDYLRNASSRLRVNSYLVVETDEVVNYMRTKRSPEDQIQYVTIDQVTNTCDLVYCNSVLQYCQSNSQFLSVIERACPRYILLDDLVALGEDDFYSIQNYYDSGIPYRFIGLGKLLTKLQLLGYQEIIKLPYSSPILGASKPFEMENFPQDRRLRYSLSLFLEKSMK